MHAAGSRAHHPQGRQEHLHVLRISHHRRERHRTHFLRAEGNYGLYTSPAAPQRRPPSLRGPLQEVSGLSLFGPLACPPPLHKFLRRKSPSAVPRLTTSNSAKSSSSSTATLSLNSCTVAP